MVPYNLLTFIQHSVPIEEVDEKEDDAPNLFQT